MIFFDPCRTKPINYERVFQKHIHNKLKLPNVWPNVQPTFKMMDNIRATFDWKKINSQESFGKPEMQLIQDNMEEYLRHCIFLSTKFKFGGKDGVVGFQADWEMSFTKKTQKSSHILFEISCFLFNYSMLNYNQATYLLSKKSASKEDNKTALEKLRYAKWACLELKKIQPELSKVQQLPLELTESSVDFLVSLMEGLSYLCFFNMLSDGSNPNVKDENLASLEREIAKWFYKCRSILKTNKNLAKKMKKFFSEILNNYYHYSFAAVLRMARSFGDKHKAAVTKGFIGIQLAYLKQAQVIYNQMKSDDDFPMKKNLRSQFKDEIEPELKDVDQKVREVYKCSVPEPEELNYIKPIETKITGLEPKNIRLPPKDAQYFSPFYSEQLEGVKSALSLFISNKKSHIQKSLFDLKEKIREIDHLYHVDIIVNAANQKSLVRTPEFEKQLKEFKSNGGKAAYEKLDKSLKDMRKRIENQLAKTDKIVEAEEKKDQSLEKSIGQQGIMTKFTQANAGELSQLNRKLQTCLI